MLDIGGIVAGVLIIAMLPEYNIGTLNGFTPGIADLVSMMHYARYTTLTAVEGLTVAELDHLHDEQSNSIGALLLHFAAVEHYFSILTFEGRAAQAEELEPWLPGLDLGESGREIIRGHELGYYTEKLATVRENTLAELARRNDDWLRSETTLWIGAPANIYFIWFHMFEDEINHRGQIRWLRKRLPG